MTVLNPAGLPESYPFQRDWEVTPREFRDQRAAAAPPVLIDVRTEAERHICLIEGSVHLPLAGLPHSIGRLNLPEDAQLVVHCHHGVRSMTATALLRQAGFLKARSLAGGIHLWSLDIDPSVPIY